MNIEKEFIPYEQAVELKELGFDESCFTAYLGNKLYFKCDDFLHLPATDVLNPLKAPTYRQAFKFFRDKYKLSSWIYNSDLDKYFFTVLQNGRIIKANQSTDIYEEAELECLNKLIEICKNEQ